MHSQELYQKKKKNPYYSIFVCTNKWTAYSILDPITRKKKKDGSRLWQPSQNTFKGKEAKLISDFHSSNSEPSFRQIQWKVPMSRTWQFHVFIQSDTAINTHQYKMNYSTFHAQKDHTGKPPLCWEHNDGQKGVALMKNSSINGQKKGNTKSHPPDLQIIIMSSTNISALHIFIKSCAWVTYIRKIFKIPTAIMIQILNKGFWRMLTTTGTLKQFCI